MTNREVLKHEAHNMKQFYLFHVACSMLHVSCKINPDANSADLGSVHYRLLRDNSRLLFYRREEFDFENNHSELHRHPHR